MNQVISIEKGKLQILTKKAFRNWKTQFKEVFSEKTVPGHISMKTLSFLAQGKDKSTFYLYDLIMALNELGSGFEFNDLSPQNKMRVIDQYLFLLDRIRFECMKRLKWLESYPGQDLPLVEMILHFDRVAPNIQAQIPLMRNDFEGAQEFFSVQPFEKEGAIRKLIPRLIKELEPFMKTP